MEYILTIILAGYVAYLTSRVNKIESFLEKNKQAKPSEVQVDKAVNSDQFGGVSAPPESIRSFSKKLAVTIESDMPPPPSLSPTNPFIEWVKKDFFVKLGALLLIIAVGWFVSYAFANNWIGPVGRIALGLMFGAGLLAFGTLRMKISPTQGSVFAITGSSVIIMTTFAARSIYDFYTPAIALAIMFSSVALVAFISVRYQRVSMVIAGLVLAAVSPFLTYAPEMSVTSLSLYLLVIVIGTLWAVYYLQASVVTLVALIIVFLYQVPTLGRLSVDELFIGLMFSFVFTTIFFTASVVSVLRKNKLARQTPHYVTALGIGLYQLLWITAAAPESWVAPLYIFWALVFSTGSFAVYAITSNRIPFYIYSTTALALMAAATAEIFAGASLTIVYAVQVCGLVVLANELLKEPRIARALSFLYIGVFLVSFQHLGPSIWFFGDFSIADALALVIVTISLIISGTSLLRHRVNQSEQGEYVTASNEGGILLLVALAYVLVLIWLQMAEWFVAGTAIMFSLILYTLIGLVLYILGRVSDILSLLNIGRVIIIGVVARLLLIDIWLLETEIRIIVFFIVGALLLSTAFIKNKHNK